MVSANIPGSPSIPGVYTNVQTLSRGVSLPGGVRLAALMGEGARIETIIASAVGGGRDGLDPTGTTTTGANGRYFRLSNAPIISNRTTLFKNGIPLVGVEDKIDDQPFDDQYDYRIDIDTGLIELQAAFLVDQGGEFYSAGGLNVGNGVINNLELIDENAPTESWTVRCVSVRRDGYGNPIDGYAKFVAQGSVSGSPLDGYGNQIVWESNGQVVSNGILSFSISEGTTPFIEGDRFIVETKGGTLLAGDSLTATYIAVIDINDIQFFDNINDLTDKHGSPSLSNRLSLGGQLAFANQPPGAFTIQCAPTLPRRVSYILEESATGESDVEDLTFALPLDVVPDPDANINFFITDPITGIETQILPNKVDFYNPAITDNPLSFLYGPAFEFSYTVILQDSVQKEGRDGVIEALAGNQAKLSSESVSFDADDESATRRVVIFNATNPQNNGSFDIVDVTGGDIIIQSVTPFVNETGVEFQVLDSAAQSAVVLFTDDLALAQGQTLRATVVDVKDADFYDPGWITAYEELEKIDCDIVVPLPSQLISEVFANGKQHVLSMSNIKNRKERLLFIGAIQGLNPENVIGTEPAAVEDIGILEGIQGDDVLEILNGNVEDLADYGVENSYGDTFRVVYFYPDEIVVQLGADRTLVDGFFLAAAAAGYLSGVPNVAIPLTNKTLSGFTILRDKLYRPIILEQLQQSGITVLQPTTGGGRVIHGITTTNSGFVEEEEISIVFIRDRVAKAMRSGFRGFIGKAESESLQGSLVSRAVGLLNGFIGSGLISKYAGLKVSRDDVNPTQWNIEVQVQPIYPINYIYIKISVGLI